MLAVEKASRCWQYTVRPAVGNSRWRSLLFLPSHGFRVVAPSRPGYDATPLSSGLTVSDQVDLFADLMEHLGFEHYAVVCWSGGGPLGITLAARFPARVTALYLQACVTRSYEYTAEQQKKTEPLLKPMNAWSVWLMLRLFPRPLLLEVIKMDFEYETDQARPLFNALLQDETILPYVKQVVAGSIPPSRKKKGFRNDIVQFADLEWLPLESVQAPTLIVQGKQDHDVNPECAEFAAEKIAESKLMLLDDVSHMPRLSKHGKMIGRALLDWLQQHRLNT